MPSIAAEVSLTGQAKAIYNHLRTRGSISPIEALHVHGVYRLSDVIHKLRKRGFPIKTEMREDAVGKTYGRYHLVPTVN